MPLKFLTMGVRFAEINQVVEHVFFVVFLFVILSFGVVTILSILGLLKYRRKLKYRNAEELLSTKYLPGISIIAPAFNEGKTIVENVRSLLSLSYPDFEIIVCNDGSTDDSLQKLIDAYSLVPGPYSFSSSLYCERIKVVYRSTNPAFSHLFVIDKENGGKSDALNAGVNISCKPLVFCIDVDCIILHDGLLRIVRPFLEEQHRKVVAVGAVVRLVNNCKVENGRITQVNLPHGWLERFQSLEYLRVFTLTRTGWAYIRGMMIISGAVGLFDKEILIKAGGYMHGIVGEDMEMVVRIHRYMHEVDRRKYIVDYIPDPICWTQGPATAKVLSRQRNRWGRGLLETTLRHKKLFFNPKYGIIGMVSFPYTVLVDWFLIPLELFGILYIILLYVLGMLNIPFFIMLFLVVYSFFMMITISSIFFEEIMFHHYNKKIDLVKLVFIAMLEPFFYHPLNFMWTVKGNIDHFFRGKREWGRMERTGFVVEEE